MDKKHSTIILAGGASQRMGRDKATLPWHNGLLIEHLVRLFAPASQQVIVVAAQEQNIPALPEGVTIIRDESPFLGPLLGLRDGLRHAASDLPVFVTGCDYPLLSQMVPAYLLEQCGSADVCLFKRDNYRQPLPGLYRPRILSRLDAVIRMKARSLQALLDVVTNTEVEEATWQQHFPAEVFMNMNTPKEYEQALLRFAKRSAVASKTGESSQ